MMLAKSDHKVQVDVTAANTVAQNLVSFVTAGEELVEHTKREDGVDSPSMQTTMQKQTRCQLHVTTSKVCDFLSINVIKCSKRQQECVRISCNESVMARKQWMFCCSQISGVTEPRV